jgi:hypothetical protein
MSFKVIQAFINRRRRVPRPGEPTPLDAGLGFTIRFAYPDDEAALGHLAALDSKPLPTGRLLVAEVGGELWAAVTISGHPEVIADPFQHTAALVALLRERAHRLGELRYRAAAHPASTVAWS